MSTSPAPTASGPTRRRKRPLVAVIGTTGVGKTDLGVELALSLSSSSSSSPTRLAPRRAEVVNHDSMQCYRGLDVITNKATSHEMRGVPHHLMGFLEPGQEWGVQDFVRDALDKIDELEEHETLPIAVGGTSYYLQNLVFPGQLVGDISPSSRPSSPDPTSSSSRPATPPPVPAPRTLADLADFPPPLLARITSLPSPLLALFLAFPSLPSLSSPSSLPPSFSLPLLPPSLRSPESLVPALYALLQHVDPPSAARWHWRDVRKVSRAIEIVWTARTWDDVRDAQQERPSEGARFRTLIFWLYADPDALHARLDARVDKMLERGLLSEIDELWQVAHEPGADPVDYSKGIYQAIGYKEFAPYLSLAHSSAPSSSSSSSPPPGPDTSPALRASFDAAVRTMKTSTRQYAKRQVKWIRGKLLPAVRDEVERATREGREGEGDVVVVLLDATDLSKWRVNVRDPAVDLLHKFLDGAPLPDPRTLSPAAAAHLAPPSSASTSHAKRPCPTCTRDPARPFLVEERQWDAHLGSKTHRVAARKRVQREGQGRGRGAVGREVEEVEDRAREGDRAASGSEAGAEGDEDVERR
ncbi:hypothetical protein JCM8208_003499 [Rhodotorula glutinis]